MMHLIRPLWAPYKVWYILLIKTACSINVILTHLWSRVHFVGAGVVELRSIDAHNQRIDCSCQTLV